MEVGRRILDMVTFYGILASLHRGRNYYCYDGALEIAGTKIPSRASPSPLN